MTKGELAAHTHTENTITADKNSNPIVRLDKTGGNIEGAVLQDLAGWSKTSTLYLESGTTGGDNYHNNIIPCVAAHMWKRKA